jgi:hypothetical protein
MIAKSIPQRFANQEILHRAESRDMYETLIFDRL